MSKMILLLGIDDCFNCPYMDIDYGDYHDRLISCSHKDVDYSKNCLFYCNKTPLPAELKVPNWCPLSDMHTFNIAAIKQAERKECYESDDT